MHNNSDTILLSRFISPGLSYPDNYLSPIPLTLLYRIQIIISYQFYYFLELSTNQIKA